MVIIASQSASSSNYAKLISANANQFHELLQCDQKKIAKCVLKLPKNDFTRKIKDFDTFTKIA